jgi:hypothetical protein
LRLAVAVVVETMVVPAVAEERGYLDLQFR